MNLSGGDFKKEQATMTKTEIVERILTGGKKITSLSAMKVCGTMRLSAIIFTLKKKGLDIISTWKSDTQGCRYAEYRLNTSPCQQLLSCQEPQKLIEYKP